MNWAMQLVKEEMSGPEDFIVKETAMLRHTISLIQQYFVLTLQIVLRRYGSFGIIKA